MMLNTNRTLKSDTPEFELLLCPWLASWLTPQPQLSRLQNGVYNDRQLVGLTLGSKLDNIWATPATRKNLPITVIFISKVRRRKCGWVFLSNTVLKRLLPSIQHVSRRCPPRNTIFFSSRTFRCFLTVIKLKCLSPRRENNQLPHQFYLWNKMLWFSLLSSPPLCTVSLK